ncbi:hypothetical protein HZB78_06365 [Candidatus Collierbacteria bacterium]|nr:hypothetical protein [Candidatus Collierbacteria bacterium]
MRQKGSSHHSWKPERNKLLYQDYQSKMSLVDLVTKYRVAPSNIYRVVNIMKREERRNARPAV